jgi:hypothetical protein
LQLVFSCKTANYPHNPVSKKQKLLEKLLRTPAPKDFTWEELVALMRHHEFEALAPAGGGSHYTFQHSSGFCFMASKTHPSGILKAYQVKDVKEALAKVGVIGD